MPGKDVQAVIVGGGFSPQDFDAIKSAVDAVKPMPFFRADVSRAPPGATGPPPPEKLKERTVASMEEARKEGGGQWKPGVYLF